MKIVSIHVENFKSLVDAAKHVDPRTHNLTSTTRMSAAP